MPPRRVSPSRRTGSTSATPLRDVMESENERDDAPEVSESDHLEAMEQEEKEREERFQEAERELMSVLETDGVSDHVRKRQLTRLFDRFRYEYGQISSKLRESFRMQRKIMDKCIEMKNELVMSATKIKVAKQVQDEEMKNLVYYREECEHAWQAASVCEERERDAMRIIDELKNEIEDLHAQVKTLLGLDPIRSNTATQSKKNDPAEPLSPVKSPTKRVANGNNTPTSPSKTKLGKAWGNEPELGPARVMGFDEWKIATRVWDPRADQPRPKEPAPSREHLFSLDRQHEITKCVSVPSLQPTAMERAATAVALSPSRRHTPEPQLRAATSVGSKRTAPQALPTVTTRKAHPT